MATKNEKISVAKEEARTEHRPITVSRKLTLKGLVGGAARMREVATEKGIEICRVVGICTGTKLSKHIMPDGRVMESIGLTGEFTGKSSLDSASVYAPICYIPEPIPSMVAAKLTPDNDGVQHVFRVEIAVAVRVKKDDTSATGYVYEIVPLKQFEESPELKMLTESIK